MKTYDAIIYDIDGVLLDTTKMNMIPLLQIIKEELDIDMSYEEVLRFVAYPGMKVMEELNITNKEEVYARWVQYINEYEEGATPFVGVVEMLCSLHQNIRQGIVSSKTREQYEIDFVSKKLDQYIEVAILADDTTKHKPDPEPLLLCLKKMNLDPKTHNIIYIGDALSDYLAANTATIDFGYASWGSFSDEGIINPTYIFKQPKDILNSIKKR